EFDAIEQPAYPQLATQPATDIVGGGPFNLVAGQITDDTQLAVCLARSLAACGGLDVADVSRRYLAWFDHPFDVGPPTCAAADRRRDRSAARGRTGYERRPLRLAGPRAAAGGQRLAHAHGADRRRVLDARAAAARRYRARRRGDRRFADHARRSAVRAGVRRL